MPESSLRDGDYRFGRLNVHVDRRQARSIFEKALASLQLLDLGSDFGDLSLHFECVGNLVCLAHDLEKLNFECFLSFDSRFEIDEVFGHVLAGHLFGGRVAGQFLDLVKGAAELIRRHPDHEFLSSVRCAGSLPSRCFASEVATKPSCDSAMDVT